MLKAIDTHAHLDFSEFDTDRAKLIERLDQEKIGVVNVATSVESIEKVLDLTKHSGMWATVGVHPTDITAEVNVALPGLIEDWSRLIAKNSKIVAIGEIGLDYYREASRETATVQKAALRQLLTFSQEVDLPVIFHCRAAYGDLLTLLEGYKVRGVIHCFSGTSDEANGFLERGLYLSFTANVTYPNSQALLEVIKLAPLERIMLETDSPFLAPQNHRGKRNDPLAIFEVARVISQVKNLSIDEVVQATTANASSLFGLDLDS